MQYYRVVDGAQSRLVAAVDGTAYDLASANANLTSFRDLARAANVNGTTVDAVADRHVAAAAAVDLSTATVARPVVPDEVWAAGVTYGISERAREEESSMPEMYLDVYGGERPEVFFKATPDRVVGPNEAVGIRGDSEWDVPEPELGVVLYRGEIVGYTVGNDVSSRSIEGANPLYLPQAKVYDRSCALGPCVVSTDEIDDPHGLEMSMVITRNGEVMYDDSTSTGEMVRTCEELVSYYTRYNAVPELSVLLTGTSLVPEESFTLAEGDRVSIDIGGIGTLENDVVEL
ncbi:fumarylacetoacetate hydrolase family protein [Halomarina pelagica]|uniref:fumarylacetoacetate hydrolase family protein n=1 Tax=Halomarina pelagica TaxID=2961599 RepID=UPI0020C279EF|nr:fumarylacetoacetate hydrolase family protein [Halomarina sp. BND7]